MCNTTPPQTTITPPASGSWGVETPPDTTAPQTTITSQPPASTTETAASFSFSASESGSSFACKLDAGTWSSCISPKSYSSVTVGSHTFAVKATDTAGNADSTPATHTWTVEAPVPPSDTTAPQTTITSQPPASTTETAASFSFSASESGSSFACKLDAGSWGSCSSPKGYSGLSAGEHTFSVRATDLAGNVDATPASGSWVIETGSGGATSHCFTSPHTCGYPDDTNTGVPAGTTLTSSGSITASTNGQMINAKNITGTVYVAANNVTIENSKITPTTGGSGVFVVSIQSGKTGTLIKDTTITGKGTGSQTAEAAVRGGPVTLERDNFSLCNECVQYGNPVIKDTYMKVSSIYSGAHAEDVYICSETVNVNHSTLINEQPQTATVFGDTICGGGNHFTVINSLLAGGGFIVYPQANNSNPANAQTTITGNHIARCLTAEKYDSQSGGHPCSGGPDANGFYANGGYFGVGAYFSGPITWSGNVWDDNLATVPKP